MPYMSDEYAAGTLSMHTTLNFVKFEDVLKLDHLFRGHLDWDLIFKGNLMLQWRVALF